MQEMIEHIKDGHEDQLVEALTRGRILIEALTRTAEVSWERIAEVSWE